MMTMTDDVTTTTLPAPDGTALMAALMPLLPRLQAVEAQLNSVFIERTDAVRAVLVALLARQHCLLLGPPGAAKSEMVNALARLIGDPSGAGLSTFTYLMTRYTVPEELLGPISVQGLRQDQYRRITTGRLPEAEVVFLDEIAKANSAILNCLLTVLQERQFDNDGRRVPVPLLSLYGASNELPQGEDLAALFDRFSLRLVVDYTTDSGFGALLGLYRRRRQARWQALAAQGTASGSAPAPPAATAGVSGPGLTRADLALLQAAVAALPLPDGVAGALEQARRDLLAKGIVVSDRRYGWAADLLTANALLEGRLAAEEDDLTLLADAFWQLPEQRGEIRRLVARLANPLNARAVELGDQAASVRDGALAAQRDASLDEPAKMQAAIEAATKLKAIAGQLGQLLEQARAQGRPTGRIERIAGQVRDLQMEITALIL